MFTKSKVTQSMVDAVNEALKGDQHKIDANKNKKIDAQDFEILRSKKEVKEELKGDQHKIDANKNNKIDAQDFKILRKQKKETYGEEAMAKIVEASYSAKAARAGKDIGKPGKEFAKIAKSAAERYGSEEKGKKVAGAVLAKLRMKEDVGLDEARKLEGTYSNKNGHESKVYKLSGEHNEGDPYHVKLFKNGKHHEPADYFTNDKDDAHSTAKAMVKEEVELEERTLTEPEAAEKERIVKGMKKGLQGFKQRYGERAKSVMYATATKLAKEDTVQEGENKQVKGGDPCWTGYQMVGMKNKGGKKVPNCVPEETQCDTPMNRTTKIAKSAFEAVKNRTKVK